jgi:hypothetical protein
MFMGSWVMGSWVMGSWVRGINFESALNRH